MRKVVIVDYLRSAFSRSRPKEPERDKLYPLRIDHVAAMLVEKIVERTRINPSEINELIVASAFGVWEQWTYGGRSIALEANAMTALKKWRETHEEERLDWKDAGGVVLGAFIAAE